MDDRPKVFASLPAALMAYAQSLGVGRGELLATARLTEEELVDPDELVDYSSTRQLWKFLVERFPERAIGLGYATSIQPSTVGILGYACTNARDFRQALSFYRRFVGLADPHMSLQMEDLGETMRLMIGHDPVVIALEEPVEMMVGAMVRVASALNPAVRESITVSFAHAQRHPTSEYVKVLGSEPVFGAPFTGGVFVQSLLDLPLAGAEPRIAAYLERQAESMLADRGPTEDDLPARVRHAIDGGLLSAAFDQASIAKHLGTSVRSLQRGLSGAGTSFSEQLDQVRHARALGLLERRELTIADVAFMLGYSEPRGFYRSFRRWTGRSPTAWRKR